MNGRDPYGGTIFFRMGWGEGLVVTHADPRVRASDEYVRSLGGLQPGDLLRIEHRDDVLIYRAIRFDLESLTWELAWPD